MRLSKPEPASQAHILRNVIKKNVLNARKTEYRVRAGADVGRCGGRQREAGIYIVLLVRRSSDIEYREDGLGLTTV